MSDYVKSIAKQGTAEWSNYDGDLKPKTDYVILAFYVDPNNEDQLEGIRLCIYEGGIPHGDSGDRKFR